jgi:putative transposase
MPRHARFVLPRVPLHIVHRANNRQPCFLEDVDFRVYLRSIETHAQASSCDVHAYALMTNHVHILITPAAAHSPGQMMKAIAQNFTQYMNRKRGRSGSLWEGRFWSGMVGEGDYLLRCQRYVELNPLFAGMCFRPEDYPWTSFSVNAGLSPRTFVRPHKGYLWLGNSDEERLQLYRSFMANHPSDREREEIQAAVKGGFAWGGAEFLDTVTQQCGAGAVRRRGRDRKDED